LARDIRFEALRSSFKVIYRNSFLGEVEVPLPGIHNLYNCLAAVGVGIKLGIPWGKIKKTLTFFAGVKRRLEKIGEAGSILVFDDYAHHPTEIEATLQEIHRLGRRVLVIFQPHRYTRCKLLLSRFSTAFNLADLLILTPIYPAGEPPLPGIKGETLFEVIRRKRESPTYYLSSFGEIVEFIEKKAGKDDLIITLGAGDISQLSTQILNRLLKREELR
jgi:UDP-N-acetylmuramate--alanine ligase